MMPNPSQPEDSVLVEAAAAEFLGLSVRTLQQWRVSGRGPQFLKMGRSVRYRKSQLVRFLEICSAGSTAEASMREACHG
jgi:predicted DNA-binding transcriptional regulator AlpA